MLLYRGTQKIAGNDKADRICVPEVDVLTKHSKMQKIENTGFICVLFVNTFKDSFRKLQKLVRPIVFECVSLMF